MCESPPQQGSFKGEERGFELPGLSPGKYPALLQLRAPLTKEPANMVVGVSLLWYIVDLGILIL